MPQIFQIQPPQKVMLQMGSNAWSFQLMSGSTSTATVRYSLIMASLLLLPLMMSPVGAARLVACSAQLNICVCNSDNIRCVGSKSITAVPEKIPQNLTSLTITQTNLRRIEENDFKSLENTQVLYLQDNQINFFHKFALRNMYKLRILNLERNNLINLDPDGLLFQHLPSIELIALQTNGILKMNRYSFLTAVSNKRKLEVKMYDNPVQCDCDVLALRNWMNDVPDDRITFDELTCSNDPRGRPYTQIPTSSSVFGNCPAYPCTSESKESTSQESEDLDSTTITQLSSTQAGKSLGNKGVAGGLAGVLDDLFPNGSPFEGGSLSLFEHEEPAAPGLGVQVRTITEPTVTETLSTKSGSSQKPDCGCKEKNKSEAGKSASGDSGGGTSAATGGKVQRKCGDLSNIFDTMFECRTCEKERTNHACNLKPSRTCTGLQMVCLRSVIWEEGNKTMLVSSRCESYTSCLDREARNADRCGAGYQNNGDVKCEFCCMGPTCQPDSIGGRTYDLTLYVNYLSNNGPYRAYMADASSSQYRNDVERITTGVRNDIQNVKGGVDVYLESFRFSSPNAHTVTLRIEITAMTYQSQTDIFAAIEQDMESSVASSTGFLFAEKADKNSLLLRENLSGNMYCRSSTTSISTKGTFTWDAEPAGSTQVQACPFDASAQKFARRSCRFSVTSNEASWGLVDAADCPVQKESLDDVINTDITPGNVQRVTSMLEELTGDSAGEEFTPEMLNQVVTVLETCVEPDKLQEDGVASSVVRSLSNLLDADLDVMRDGEKGDDTSSRIVTLLDTVAEKAPLTDGQFKVVTTNVAVAAQAVDERETRDVAIVANKVTDKEKGTNDDQVKVDFTDKNKQPAMDSTSLVLPLSALIQSLSPAEKGQLERVSFIVHQSDKLFSRANSTSQSMQEPEESKPALDEDQGPNQRVSDGSDDESEDDVNDSKEAASARRFIVKVNSMVLSATVPGVIVRDLTENVTMTFEHQSDNATNPRCVFWDEVNNDWSSDGCGVVTSSPGVTQCGCNHLTNFALLMDVYQEGTSLGSLDRKILSFISYVGCGVSLAALLLTLVTYAFFRKLRRDNPSKILVNLCLALLLSNLVYLIGMHDYSFDNSTACKIVAVLLHYSLLASLSWMAVEAFYMYLALILVFKTYFSNFILKCALFGWGVPLLVVIVTLAIDSTDNYGFINSGMCWLRNPAFYAAFVGPVCLILLVNCIAFGLVIKQLSNMSSSKLNKTDRNSTVQRLRGAIGIVILLGLTWIFAVFAIGEASVVFYYLFAIFNSLQGLFIFIFYCVMKKDALSAWKHVLPCFEEYGESTKSSSNSRAVSQSAANTNAVNVKYRPNSASSTQGTTSSSTTAISVVPDSRKGSVTTILDNGNVYNTIDDGDIYINLNNSKASRASSHRERPPSYSVAANDPASAGSNPEQQRGLMDNPATQRYPYADEPPTAYSYRNGNLSSPKNRFSPTGQVNHGMQPFSPAFSFPERHYQQQQQEQHHIPRPRVEGEVDSSNMAKVRDIRLKYERTMSQTSNNNGSNI